MLSRIAILKAISENRIKIEPFSDDQVELAHINLHLADNAELQPKEFLLSQTKESVTLSENVGGLVDGKASLAKQGISIHQSSMLAEPGTDNSFTLEIFNASDQVVRLQAGQEIAKLILFDIE